MEIDIPKKYFHDRIVLLLITVNTFLAIIALVSVLLRMDASHGTGYFVQYRSNLGLNAYKIGGYSGLLSLAIFGVLVDIFHTVISIRLYTVRREIALTVLGFATLLLVLIIVVTNSLLVLR